MRTSSRVASSFLASVLAVFGVACGGGAGASSSPSSPGTTAGDPNVVTIVSFAMAPESGQVDKVGTVDGNFAPDQTPDLVFDVTVQGAPKALFLETVDRQGKPNKKYGADTLVKDEQAPAELGGELEQGAFSGGIGVYENGKIVNNLDGSLAPQKPGRHTWKIYVNKVELFGTGGQVRFYASTPDGKLVASQSVDY